MWIVSGCLSGLFYAWHRGTCGFSVTVLPVEVTATMVIVVAPLLHGRFVRLMFSDAGPALQHT